MRNSIFFVLIIVVALLVTGGSHILAGAGYPGIESKDPERYYQRLKYLRAKRNNDPDNTYRIANVYYSLKMEDEAIKEYRRVLKLDPNNLDAKWFLSRLLYNKGYFNQAFRLGREIMEKNSDDPEIYYWMGEILLKLDQNNIAKEYFARCDELKIPERKKPSSE